MSLCKRLEGGPKSLEELWSKVDAIAQRERKTSRSMHVVKEDKLLQALRDETIYVVAWYDHGNELAFKLEKTKGIFGPTNFKLFARVEDVWKEIPRVSSEMTPDDASGFRDFDLYNYSLLLMLNCEG